MGKTYDMLNEGCRRKSRGTDVIVGYVETHGRPNTEAQLRELEVIPRRTVEYRGQHFEEMDADAVLARKPKVALVDELAHTNVPGSRNEKRWQDIHELLDAGIDIVSTVNIQHLESLNDVVEGITGIKQQETVPDAVVRAAEQIELVDMTPEALRRRMAHGNIYKPDKVDAALGNYFRQGNLTALRELALMWVAGSVDDRLDEYREQHGITKAWETRERVVVALTGVPGGDGLIRRAARISQRTHGELIGVHVRVDDGLTGARAEAMAEHRRLLEELDGTYREVVGSDVAVALVQAARAENATQIVLGASRRSRWTELTRGSVINRVIRAAGGSLDVHVISATDEGDGEARRLPVARRRAAPLPARRQITGFLLALGGLPLLTLALTELRDQLNLPSQLLCFLLLVVAVATVGGAWPAVTAAIAAFLLLNWYFTPPIHQWTIAEGENVFALVAFVVVAGVVSALVDHAARRSADARRARAEASALAGMAGSVLRGGDPLPELLDSLCATFRLEGAAIVRRVGETWVVDAAAGVSPPGRPEDGSVSLPLRPGVELVVLGHDLAAGDREVLNAFATQLAVALESRRLQREASTAAALVQANEMRSALLAAVSHDLRTPLTSIKTSASSLLSDDVDWPDDARRALLETIDDEADRLNTLVGNLLDMSRLQAGAVVVRATAVGLEEVVAGALAGLSERDVKVEVDVPETLPQVEADPALLERAVANIVDNAIGFSPPAGVVRVEAGEVNDRDGHRVVLRVVDRGPGIPVAARTQVFQPFQRPGDNPNGEGVGLGLAVAHGFVTAMGGELEAEDTPGGGTTMIVGLRVAES